MAFFLHYVPHSDFERGIFVPFATRKEAEMQAAADLLSTEADFFEGIFQAPYETPKYGWTIGAAALAHTMPHLDPEKRKQIMTRSQIAKAAPKHQKAILEAAAQAQADFILEIDKAIRQGRAPLSGAVPGNAYSVMTGGTATSGAVALAAATAKTVVMITAAAANQPCIVEIGVSFDGVTPSAVPVLIELVSGTATSTGTVTAQTPKQLRGWPAQTAQTTAQINATVEPTVQLVNRKWLLTPTGIPFPWQFPLGREPTGIVTATTDAKTWSLRITASAVVNVHASIEFEE